MRLQLNLTFAWQQQFHKRTRPPTTCRNQTTGPMTNPKLASATTTSLSPPPLPPTSPKTSMTILPAVQLLISSQIMARPSQSFTSLTMVAMPLWTQPNTDISHALRRRRRFLLLRRSRTTERRRQRQMSNTGLITVQVKKSCFLELAERKPQLENYPFSKGQIKEDNRLSACFFSPLGLCMYLVQDLNQAEEWVCSQEQKMGVRFLCS